MTCHNTCIIVTWNVKLIFNYIVSTVVKKGYNDHTIAEINMERSDLNL